MQLPHLLSHTYVCFVNKFFAAALFSARCFKCCTVVSTCRFDLVHQTVLPHERVESGYETAKNEQKLEVGKAREQDYHWDL